MLIQLCAEGEIPVLESQTVNPGRLRGRGTNVIMLDTPPGDTKDQQDFRSRGKGDYRPRHRELELAEPPDLAAASIASAVADGELAPPQPAGGRHQGARARWPRLRRRGSHGLPV
jgi:hypothetical protein